MQASEIHPNAVQLLQAFRAAPPQRHGYQLLPALLTGPVDQIEQFVDGVLATLPKGGTFFDDALSFLPADAIERLVKKWLTPLTEDSVTEAVAALVSCVSLQFPSLLHPFLEILYAARPGEGGYDENFPWREAPPDAIRFLLERADQGDKPLKAFECLLEMRSPAALTAAVALAPQLALPHTLENYLISVGFSADHHALYDDQQIHHLIFPQGYLARSSAQNLHPTWQAQPQPQPASGAQSCNFGGPGQGVCGFCGGALHRLLEAPEHLLGLSTSSKHAALEVCLSCLGYERHDLHYHHDADGAVHALDKGDCEAEFPAQPFPVCQVQLVATQPRWRWQDWGLSNNRQNLHRLGGFPSWVQSADHPQCRSCQQKMRFILQLDSDLPAGDGDGDEWLWGSGGVCYGFSCQPCRNTAFLWQCT